MRLSTRNLNMPTLPVYDNGQLACPIAIRETPIGAVLVTCQWQVVVVAEHTESWAYWSRDGGRTALKFRDLQIGDRLYWNPSKGLFNSWWYLSGYDSMSFIYLTDDAELPPDPDPGPIIEGSRPRVGRHHA